MIFVRVKRKGKPWRIERIVLAEQLREAVMPYYSTAGVEGLDLSHPDGAEYRVPRSRTDLDKPHPWDKRIKT